VLAGIILVDYDVELLVVETGIHDTYLLHAELKTICLSSLFCIGNDVFKDSFLALKILLLGMIGSAGRRRLTGWLFKESICL
jgi:hypothetical protein